MSKVIEGLMPFNKFFYKSCLYNSFFSILEYYKINLLHILGYTDGYYHLSEKNQLEFNYIDALESSNEKEMLINLAVKAGLEVRIYDKQPDLTFINKEIALTHPVIAIIDCYYMPYRNDTYKKKHVLHPFLIKGYDEQEKVYYVIDQINDESLTYSDFKISYDDLKFGLKSYDTCEAEDFFYCLSSYSFNNNSNVDLLALKKYAIDIKKTYHQKIYQGLCEFNTYIEVFNVKSLVDNIDNVILQLNDIANFKLVEKHKLALLFEPPYKELNELNDKTLKCWKTFRRDLYMFYCSNKKNTSVLYDNLKNLLCDIYVQEKEYYDLFLQI
ncbi:BtrH N-terminal domain-containing protein [Ruminiclostridium herbifermentans]|uniref:BtrH N-terminal domain-containing protein n=1 Tax=Ruminiclostridium herbifermentans TaxID=2488810 RepID=A0A4U7JJJ3_9FIRM|nr:BtrH N-terminal domain-containing protein [Ruminiclostridium herbifermentans]QNU66237.1 BtrH N-terminal domain-containing protein [Ruminiclostridium herbifermentans]